MARLRTMSASVSSGRLNVYIENTGEVRTLDNALVLTSYSSIVAAYCDGAMYLFPRYDYRTTTTKHVHAFMQDFTDLDVSYQTLRQRMNDPLDDTYNMVGYGINRWGDKFYY